MSWRLRIFLDVRSLDMLGHLLSSIGADDTSIVEHEEETYLEVVFSKGPSDLIDRVEGWLNGLDGQGVARIQSCNEQGEWKEGWTGLYMGVQVGGFSIRPPWVSILSEGIDMCIDPRGGFGSGAHATTQACLMLLEGLRYTQGITSALDVGSGSGVLSVAMAKLGWSVDAVEREIAGRAATVRNAQRNNVVVCVHPDSLQQRSGKYGLITANLYGCSGVVENASLLASLLSLGGLLIVGGFRAHEGDIVKNSQPTLSVQSQSIVGEWMALSFCKKEEHA